MDDLIANLTNGKHPIAATRLAQSVIEFKKCIEQGFVFIKFLDTKGGTELGVQLDRRTTKIDDADFINSTGMVHLEGHLILNYVPVTCIADVELASLKGTGYLKMQKEAM